MKPLVVVDTNVFINSLFSNGYKNDEKILDLEEKSQIKFAFSKLTKDELYKIVVRKIEQLNLFKCSDFIEGIYRIIARSHYCEMPKKLPAISKDKGDQPFIELAVAVKSNYLITNDYQNGLLDLKEHDGVKIVTSNEFVKQFTKASRLQVRN